MRNSVCENLLCIFVNFCVYVTALKITFENLPIIKIKAVEKKVTHHGCATRKNFQNENFESVWTRMQKISVLSHAFHDFFKRSSNEGDFP